MPKALSDAIPESRRFGGGGSEECPEGLRGLHVNGVACEGLDPIVWRVLTAERTDEGLAKAKAGAGTFTVARGEVDAKMAKRRDERAAGAMPWESTDPFKEAADQFVGPGMRPKFVSSERVAKEGGLVRGGWQLLTNEKGDPIRVGDTMLAQMPEASAIARNEYYRNKSADRAKATDVDKAEAFGKKFEKDAEATYFAQAKSGFEPGSRVLDDSETARD